MYQAEIPVGGGWKMGPELGNRDSLFGARRLIFGLFDLDIIYGYSE